jgi:ATP-dependent Clp protease ATP-binding subunit ClpA
MRENENSMSVVLLDEFDHCDSETWEAFYHVFDEGKCLIFVLIV